VPGKRPGLRAPGKDASWTKGKLPPRGEAATRGEKEAGGVWAAGRYDLGRPHPRTQPHATYFMYPIPRASDSHDQPLLQCVKQKRQPRMNYSAHPAHRVNLPSV